MRLQEIIEADPEDVIVELFDEARNTVSMSSRLYPDFYNKDRVKQAMEGAAKRVDEFQLLLDANIDLKKRKTQLPWFAKLVEDEGIEVRKSKRRIRHWMIIDGEHFRLEKMHPKNALKPSNLIVWDAIDPLADMLQEKFRRWWMNGSPIG